MTAGPRVRVGIVGANPERGWARDAHVPALKRLDETFALTAVSARGLDTAEAARVAWGAERAYGDSLELVRAPDVDLVAVTVKVPEHRAIVLAALQAGKSVYCEWPLGRDLAEAREMADASAGRYAAIGLQGLSAPAVRRAVALVREGALGRLRVLRVFSPTAGWGAEAPPFYAYLQDHRNGATLETIAGGHTLALVEALAGPYGEIDARNSILRKQVRIRGSEETMERTSADHMMALGLHASGCCSTLEVAGGVADKPFRLELEGEKGWLRITGDFAGGFQGGVLTLETSVAGAPPDKAVAGGLSGPPANVAEAYARLADDLTTGRRTLPDFHRAVRLSALLDRVEQASATGRRTSGADG